MLSKEDSYMDAEIRREDRREMQTEYVKGNSEEEGECSE